MYLYMAVNLLPEELYELVGHHGINLGQVLRLCEGVGDVPLVLLQVDNLLLDDELVRILGQEVSELLGVLS